MLPKTWRKFDGKRYEIVTVTDKRAAQRRAKQLREQGKSVRVVAVAKAPKGRSGYTRTRYAEYAR